MDCASSSGRGSALHSNAAQLHCQRRARLSAGPVHKAHPRPCRSSHLQQEWGRPPGSAAQRRQLACKAAAWAAITFTAAKAGSSAASNGAAPAAAPSLLSALVALLPDLGIFILCVATSLFLLASIPTMWSMGRAADRAERVLAVVERELPDTISTMRLSGMEVTDCIQELGALGGELTRGVRSTAQLATMAEQAARVGAAAVGATVEHKIKPAMAKTEKDARGALEGQLQTTSKLSYSRPVVAQVASATATAVRRVRLGLFLSNVAVSAVQLGKAANDGMRRQAAANLRRDVE